MIKKSEQDMTEVGRVYWRNKVTINGIALLILINILVTIYFGVKG